MDAASFLQVPTSPNCPLQYADSSRSLQLFIFFFFFLANNKLQTGLLSYIICRVVQAFWKAEARIAITFTHATLHFSVFQSIIHLNVHWLPGKFFLMRLPILIVGHKYSPQRSLPHETVNGNRRPRVKWGNLYEIARISHFQIHKEGKKRKDQPICDSNRSFMETLVYTTKYYCLG